MNLESECARATERAELEEKKIAELEEELKVLFVSCISCKTIAKKQFSCKVRL